MYDKEVLFIERIQEEPIVKVARIVEIKNVSRNFVNNEWVYSGQDSDGNVFQFSYEDIIEEVREDA